nr:hypothetical protein [uncultured Polynucleobacter sp.]
MRDIAVRGFVNDKCGTTFGKGLFRRAIFNGSVELGSPKEKYLVDYFEFNDWINTAKTDVQMADVKKLMDSGVNDDDEIYCSWIQHYNPISKTKTKVGGFSVYAPNTQELYIAIDDVLNGTIEDWTLPARLCKTAGANKPIFVATNVDLGASH